MSTANHTMEAFFTRQRANEGIDLPLFLPDGTPTPHSIKIRGIDSDSFRAAEAESRRRLLDLAADGDKAKLNAAMSEDKNFLIAALVVSWTFEQAATQANVLAFLKDAPQIAEQIDRLASRRTLFFKLGSPTSSPSPAQSSS